MADRYEIEVVMNTDQTFVFTVAASKICGNGHIQNFLERQVALERVKNRKIPGHIVKITNRTAQMLRSGAMLSHSP